MAEPRPYSGLERDTLTILTPEGIAFPLVLASPVSRFLALAVDQACISVVSYVVTMAARFLGWISADLGGATAMILLFAASIGYPMFLEWFWRGQTVGKRLLRLQVMDVQGLKLEPSQVVVRNLLRVIDTLPFFYMVGGLSALLSPRCQRLGDIAANTIVIQHPRIEEPDLDQILAGKFNTFMEYPHLAARLRQNVSPAEAWIALHALLRRDQLEDDARLEVFEAIRRHTAELVAFPPEAVEGLSDERYVRNVVDILFR